MPTFPDLSPSTLELMDFLNCFESGSTNQTSDQRFCDNLLKAYNVSSTYVSQSSSSNINKSSLTSDLLAAQTVLTNNSELYQPSQSNDNSFTLSCNGKIEVWDFTTEYIKINFSKCIEELKKDLSDIDERANENYKNNGHFSQENIGSLLKFCINLKAVVDVNFSAEENVIYEKQIKTIKELELKCSEIYKNIFYGLHCIFRQLSLPYQDINKDALLFTNPQINEKLSAAMEKLYKNYGECRTKTAFEIIGQSLNISPTQNLENFTRDFTNTLYRVQALYKLEHHFSLLYEDKFIVQVKNIAKWMDCLGFLPGVPPGLKSKADLYKVLAILDIASDNFFSESTSRMSLVNFKQFFINKAKDFCEKYSLPIKNELAVKDRIEAALKLEAALSADHSFEIQELDENMCWQSVIFPDALSPLPAQLSSLSCLTELTKLTENRHLSVIKLSIALQRLETAGSSDICKLINSTTDKNVAWNFFEKTAQFAARDISTKIVKYAFNPIVNSTPTNTYRVLAPAKSAYSARILKVRTPRPAPY